jgi:hypothetical protein
VPEAEVNVIVLASPRGGGSRGPWPYVVVTVTDKRRTNKLKAVLILLSLLTKKTIEVADNPKIIF